MSAIIMPIPFRESLRQMGLNRIRIRKSIREHPLVITTVPSTLIVRASKDALPVSPRFRGSSIVRLSPSLSLSLSRSQRRTARSIGKANLWLLPLPSPTSINSFQTTKDYLLPFQTEANAYRRRQSGDNLWPRNRESVFAPSRSFPSLAKPSLRLLAFNLDTSSITISSRFVLSPRPEGKKERKRERKKKESKEKRPLNRYETIDSG